MRAAALFGRELYPRVKIKFVLGKRRARSQNLADETGAEQSEPGRVVPQMPLQLRATLRTRPKGRRRLLSKIEQGKC